MSSKRPDPFWPLMLGLQFSVGLYSIKEGMWLAFGVSVVIVLVSAYMWRKTNV